MKELKLFKLIYIVLKKCKYLVCSNSPYFISTILFFVLRKYRENNKKILKLKNKYSGRRCFIIGNGPSLKSEDLDRLHLNNEITFAANKISQIFDKTKWRPTFYAVFDEGYQRRLIDVMSETQAGAKFFNIKSYIWTKKVKGESIFLNGIQGKKWLRCPVFSDDIARGIYDIATVTYDLFQIAVYMGFKELYLIGIDNNYSKNISKDGTVVENKLVNSYFDGALDNERNIVAGSPWEAEIAYMAAREYAEKYNIKIINATRGGKLEIFPRIDFDSLF
jgi:hypothetical protein